MTGRRVTGEDVLPAATDTAAGPHLLDLRYGGLERPDAAPWNEVIELLVGHRSSRRFLARALPANALEVIVAAAQSAASSSNLQSWSVVAVTEASSKAVIAEVAGGQKHVASCPLVLVFLADLSRLQEVASENGHSPEALPFLEMFLVGAIDAAVAAQNAAVAAESLGLSTVYIGAIRNDPERIARALGLPAGVVAIVGLCVGWAAVKGKIKPRLPQSAVLHRERYDPDAWRVGRPAYDETIRAFSKDAGMPEQSWSDRVVDRVGSVSALDGRDRLKEVLQRLGFPLR